ncbi:MAG TPA: pyridoxal phosphate-dependent aminotransferase [Bacteroidetes bacterium]|nr:pyridoxal phosphate-dependent aminotransferase [Bacteroidota bacterium]
MRIFDSSREHDTPIDFHTVRKKISESRLPQVGSSSIREIVRLVNEIEQETGQQFIRMEMGVPGLPPAEVGVEAEIQALRRGVASKYPMIEGVRELKEEISRFVKLFLDVDVSPAACVPTVGSMMGSMAAFLTANRNDRYRKGTVFLDPGFPVQKQQCRMLGHEYESIDVYDCRGEKLKDRLESVLAGAAASSILYSNPNNPAWICFTEEELRMIGELSMKYDVIVIEDLAYFGMDYRQDYSLPGSPPFQPSVARYTSHYILLISSSKVFSYAGQRVGMMVMSDVLFNRQYPDLKRYYSSDRFGHAMIYGALYALSSGCSHSAQYALAAMLKAANEGEFNFIRSVKEYERRASLMKRLFTENGFHIVYDRDIDRELADGFYFTFSYPGFSGPELLEEMLYYGISSISLVITGSRRTEGLRACVSQVSPDQMSLLEERLKRFHRDHSG